MATLALGGSKREVLARALAWAWAWAPALESSEVSKAHRTLNHLDFEHRDGH